MPEQAYIKGENKENAQLGQESIQGKSSNRRETRSQQRACGGQRPIDPGLAQEYEKTDRQHREEEDDGRGVASFCIAPRPDADFCRKNTLAYSLLFRSKWS